MCMWVKRFFKKLVYQNQDCSKKPEIEQALVAQVMSYNHASEDNILLVDLLDVLVAEILVAIFVVVDLIL